MTSFGRQRLAPVFVDDVAELVADSLVDGHAIDQVFELGGPEDLSMREVISRALAAARIRRPILPAPAAMVKLVAAPLALLPAPPLTPDAVEFINQPAIVDVGPLLARMPRRLTPLDEGLATYLPPTAGPGEIVFDGPAPVRKVASPLNLPAVHGPR
jgi:NADH dehydrogenase